ncbi:MAG: hypothetical protein WC760_02435 [Bacteroidia bacterium]|jgi:hypothetical protein
MLTSICWLRLQPVHAQSLTDEKMNHAIGIGAGFTTGLGLSYRYMPAKFGVQVNFAPFTNTDVTMFSTGVTFLYNLIPGKVATLYLYQGNHFYYFREIQYYPDPVINGNSTANTRHLQLDRYFNNGVGFGIEMLFAHRIGFNLMAGYAAYNNFTGINVTGETGLYFKF